MAKIKDPQTPSPADDESRKARAKKKGLLFAILAFPVLLGFYATLLWWSSPRTGGQELRLDQYITLLRQGRISSATILETDNRITGTYDRGKYWVAVAAGRETIFARLTSALEDAGVPLKVQQQPLKNLLVPASLILPAFIVVDGFLILFLAFRGSGGDGYSAFGKSRGKRMASGESKITFADVAGVDEAIEELAEVRDYLGSPDKFLAMGAAVPKGILLTGPPGCGKTLLARALAGEANVPFFSISGSEFVEIFVGVGASRIRDFFAVAKTAAPCIVFIDELDAVGRGRTAMAVGGQDEREATLNQLLVEMDGFESGSGVIVLAATNRPEILDAALLRPGRFDRRVMVQAPDTNGRRLILDVHTRSVPLDDDVDLDGLAATTQGMVGADLANLVNEAALTAAREDKERVSMADFTNSLERLVLGSERKIMLTEADRERTAYHESGHALVGMLTPGADPVRKVSIIPRGPALGVTISAPAADRYGYDRGYLIGRIKVALAGRVAEQLVYGEITTGAESDIEQLTQIARQMVGRWGMSEAIGPISVIPRDGHGPLLPGASEVSPETQRVVDEEVRRLVEEAEDEVRELLGANRERLDALVRALMERETLDEADAYEVAGVERPPPMHPAERLETVSRDKPRRV